MITHFINLARENTIPLFQPNSDIHESCLIMVALRLSMRGDPDSFEIRIVVEIPCESFISGNECMWRLI